MNWTHPRMVIRIERWNKIVSEKFFYCIFTTASGHLCLLLSLSLSLFNFIPKGVKLLAIGESPGLVVMARVSRLWVWILAVTKWKAISVVKNFFWGKLVSRPKISKKEDGKVSTAFETFGGRIWTNNLRFGGIRSTIKPHFTNLQFLVTI